MDREDFQQKVYQAVGERIATLRRAPERGLTQKGLADGTDQVLTRSAVANIERGRQRLAVHHLYQIAKVLGVSPAELLPPFDEIVGVERSPRDLEPTLEAWLERIEGVRRRGKGRERGRAKTQSD